MTLQGTDPVRMDFVTWWRKAHERDLAAFMVSHGRQPETWLELSRWLKPLPARVAARHQGDEIQAPAAVRDEAPPGR